MEACLHVREAASNTHPRLFPPDKNFLGAVSGQWRLQSCRLHGRASSFWSIRPVSSASLSRFGSDTFDWMHFGNDISWGMITTSTCRASSDYTSSNYMQTKTRQRMFSQENIAFFTDGHNVDDIPPISECRAVCPLVAQLSPFTNLAAWMDPAFFTSSHHH